METTFESLLPPIYDSYIDVTNIDTVLLDIEPINDEISVNILTLQKMKDNPLTMILHDDNGIIFSIPSALQHRGLLIENNYLLTVTEREEPKPCKICEKDQKYGRGVVTYHTGENSNSLFKPVWVGIDCLTHIDKAIDSIDIDLNSTAVSEII